MVPRHVGASFFEKKVPEKFGGKKKTPYLCTRLQEQGRLAQLV